MNPSGVQFGISQGLLQIRGDEVLLSEKLLETISHEAQQHVQLGRRPIQGNFLVDFTVRAAQDALANQHQGSREEILHLFTDLNRTMYYTLCRVAEHAGLAHKEPERLITDPDLWAEFSVRALEANIKPGKSVAKTQKSLFKICHQLVRECYASNDPDNIRHADLTALFIFNFWNVNGLLPISQALLSGSV